ncbi:MAG: NAD(P)/FAD-dependent oxidoreductase [Hyphomicrobiales bacterium]|nr:NAD(P)/FAD-dependent oxidoreductase [Hyphomicrobiales bacterium]
MQTEYFDVIVVGAGLSGVGAGYWLQKDCPQKSFCILERRAAMGGTWDLFRYPGVRSDSDMFTLGYAFKPWSQAKAIADGPAILRYIQDTAREYGVDRKIRFGQHVVSAAWSSAEARWTLDVDTPAGPVRYACSFLHMCSGYYRYEAGYTPEFAGVDDYRGAIVHPQHWPQELDVANRSVVIIGSGATAATLAPALAKTARHVTLLQRSPTYMASGPARDKIADALRARLPPQTAYKLSRLKNTLFSQGSYKFLRAFPKFSGRYLVRMAKRQLPDGFDVAHFTPRYNPWDQRICLIPDGDLFRAIRKGALSVRTDTIARFTADGLLLDSGAALQADVIVMATGLFLQAFGGARLSVDGAPVETGDHLSYRGAMLSDVPNFAQTFGYTNASWTLKADLIARYVCRLLNAMDRKGARIAVAHNDDPAMATRPFVDFTSGYFQRAARLLPRQGVRAPWLLNQNYYADRRLLLKGPIEDGAMRLV